VSCLCQAFGTVVPPYWHGDAKHLAQLCQ